MSNGSERIDVDYVASLARLEIPAESREKLQSDLEAIVGYIDELKELDVSGVEPTAHALKVVNVWREDAPAESYPRDVMLANAPEVIDGECVRIPQVLPGEGMN